MTESSPSVRVERVDSHARLLALGEQWRELESASRLRSPFLRHCWQSLWADAFLPAESGRDLFVLVVWQNERIAGVAPLYRRQRRTLGLRVRELAPIGSPEAGADHLDFLSRQGREQLVADAVRHALLTDLRNEWDVLSLVDVPAGSVSLAHFLRAFSDAGQHVDVEFGALCPFVELPRTCEAVVGGLGARHREAVRRNARAVHRAGTVRHDTFRGTDIAPHLEPLFAAHAARWPQHDKRFYPFVRTLLTAHADESAAQLDRLTIDGSTVASYLHFDAGDCRSLYLLGVDRTLYPDINAGKLLLQLCIEQAVVGGLRVYDFLRGEEQYKFDWATAAQRSLIVSVRQARPGAIVEWRLRAAKDFGRVLFRRL